MLQTLHQVPPLLRGDVLHVAAESGHALPETCTLRGEERGRRGLGGMETGLWSIKLHPSLMRGVCNKQHKGVTQTRQRKQHFPTPSTPSCTNHLPLLSTSEDTPQSGPESLPSLFWDSADAVGRKTATHMFQFFWVLISPNKPSVCVSFGNQTYWIACGIQQQSP